MTDLVTVLFLVNLAMAVGMIVWTAKMHAKFRETPSEVHKKALERGYADLRIMAEHEKRKLAVKEFTDSKTNREIASGIVIDPGGTCLCRRCGHTVSAVYDRCIQCYNKLDWNA